MALQTKVINGKSVEFDPVVRDEILKQFLPDGGNADANLADWAVLIAGMLLATVKINDASIKGQVDIFINGKGLVVDAGTNYISASSSDMKAFAKAVVTGIIGTGVGFVTGEISTFAVGPVGGAAVGFFTGNAASSQAGQAWDYLFGPDVNVLLAHDGKSAVIKSSGMLEYVLRDHWSNSNRQLSIKDIANSYGEYTLSCASGEGAVNYTYEKSTNKYTYASGGTKHNIEELLKYLAVGDLPMFNLNGINHKLYKNFMNSSPLSEADLHDRATLYAALELQGFVLESETERYNQLKVTDFSEMFLNDRAKMFNAYTHEPTNLPNTFNTKYQDLNGDIIVKDERIPNVSHVIFGSDGADNYSLVLDRNTTEAGLHIYGLGGNDNLHGYKYDDYIEGGLGNDTIYGGGGNDTIYTNANIASEYDNETSANTNIVVAGEGKDFVMGSKASDIIYGDFKNKSDYALFDLLTNYDDTLYGNGGADGLYGGKGDDKLYGGTGADIIDGGDGDDILKNARSDGASDNESDMLKGGEGYDKYYVGNMDIIQDADRRGIVIFEGTRLLKGIAKSGGCNPDGSQEYYGDGGVYILDPKGTLTFKKGDQILTIEKYVNGALGINLFNESPGGSCPPPPPPPEPDDRPEPDPNFPSPLVLDLNGDGVTSTFISSTSTYFDLDNDGVKQRTGWVQTTDALLALDKNQDGIINDGTELFGNNTILKNGTKAANGFEALKEYDENKDGLIDAKDNIYNTLKLWQDTDSDGVTDTGELHTLSELGVASINLEYTQTTDYEEQNRIFQTSSFTTTDGTTQSINDVWFATESRDTARDTTVTLKDTVAVLPDFRGAGRAENLSTAMNEIKIEREVA